MSLIKLVSRAQVLGDFVAFTVFQDQRDQVNSTLSNSANEVKNSYHCTS